MMNNNITYWSKSVAQVLKQHLQLDELEAVNFTWNISQLPKKYGSMFYSLIGVLAY